MTSHAPLRLNPDLFRDLPPLDDRTREILDARRSTTHRRGWLVRRALLAADLLGLVVAFVIAQSFTGQVDRFGPGTEVLLFLASLPAWIVLAKLHHLYDLDEERTNHSTVDDVVGVFQLVTVGTWGLFLGSWATGWVSPTPSKLAAFWICAIALIVVFRVLARTFSRRSLAYVQNTVIVGAGDIGQLVARKILQHPEYGLNLVGFLDSDPRTRRDDLQDVQLLGSADRLPELVELLDIERVIIAFSNDTSEDVVALVRKLRRLDVQVDVVPRLFEVFGPKVSVHTIEALPLVSLPPARIPRTSQWLKRAVDIVGSAVGLLLAAPLFALAAFLVKRDSPGPIFFRQIRLGMNMREFETLKFRTMKVNTDTAAHRAFIEQTMTHKAATAETGVFKLDRSDAITRSGRWLRKTSLDELPQLINVLRGDMSLVGPRPCLAYEVEFFEEHHFERFLVPGGVTGLWQVTARAHSTFGEALDMDVVYARGWSLGLDLRLICRTPLQVLRPGGTR